MVRTRVAPPRSDRDADDALVSQSVSYVKLLTAIDRFELHFSRRAVRLNGTKGWPSALCRYGWNMLTLKPPLPTARQTLVKWQQTCRRSVRESPAKSPACQKPACML